MAESNDELNLAKGQEGEGEAPAGKSKLLLLVLALLLVGGGAAGAYFLLGTGEAPEAEVAGEAPPAAVEPETDPIYLPLSPAFVINFEQEGRTRYLQIELQVMSYDEDVIDKVQANLPAVRNSLILLFGDQDYAALATTAGKEDLRKQVLISINKVIRAKAPPRVDDVFFTAFVMQ